MSLLDNAVHRQDDDTWDVLCPVTDGTCGKRATAESPAEPFQSTGWPSEAVARDRLDQHLAEHRGESVALDLDSFRAKHGLVPSDDGKRAVVTIEDVTA